MLLSLIFLILSTYIIFIWGRLFIKQNNSKSTSQEEFNLAYIIGLCVLCFISNSLTLFTGLASPWIYAGLLIPSLYRDAPRAFFLSIQKNLWPTSFLIRSLLSISLLVLLVMHAWEIRHPDTLTYQNNLIEFALSGSHPWGIVNIKSQLGYGGSWFSLSALFSYYFITGKVMTFVNLSMITVGIAYLLKKVEIAWQENNAFSFVGYILVFCMASFEYTFIRLAVTSNAPDTPAAFMGIGIFIYFLNKRRKGWILTLISVTALTMKLSLTPTLALPLLHLIRHEGKSSWIKNILLAILISTPFLIKNVFSTGYILYPYPESKICNSAYTPSVKDVKKEADYIKAYARQKFTSRDENKIQHIVQMPFHRWVAIWWVQLSISEKSIVMIFFISLFLSFYFKKKKHKSNQEFWPYMETTIFGFIFWLNLAPSIRFGTSFLLAPLLYMLIKSENQPRSHQPQESNNLGWKHLVVILVISTVAAYLIYRIIFFMDTMSLLIPKGPVG